KQLAVSDKTEPQKLYISPDSHNHSLIKEAKINPAATKTVQTTTLDNILKNTDRCDLIKMDCEGAEFRILSSTSPETFKKIKAFYIEYHEFSPSLKKETLTQILQKNGFTNTKTTPSHYEETMGFILATKNS
ncbi:MAG: FkbM family methyltransferase, partial [Candidatus Peregrinibacteria bacterium]